MAPESDKKKDPRAWDALTPPLAEWLLDAITAMGFARMTPVQASTIGLFTSNKDVVVEVRHLLNLLSMCLTFLGCYWQWENFGLPNTCCGKAIATRRALEEAPCWRNYCLADQRARNPNTFRSPLFARISWTVRRGSETIGGGREEKAITDPYRRPSTSSRRDNNTRPRSQQIPEE
jgi:hypothetical protein